MYIIPFWGQSNIIGQDGASGFTAATTYSFLRSAASWVYYTETDATIIPNFFRYLNKMQPDINLGCVQSGVAGAGIVDNWMDNTKAPFQNAITDLSGLNLNNIESIVFWGGEKDIVNLDDGSITASDLTAGLTSLMINTKSAINQNITMYFIVPYRDPTPAASATFKSTIESWVTSENSAEIIGYAEDFQAGCYMKDLVHLNRLGMDTAALEWTDTFYNFIARIPGGENRMPKINIGNGTYPTDIVANNMKDTYLQEVNGPASWAGLTELRTRSEIGANGFSPLVRFDLSFLNNVKQINLAFLCLYTTYFEGNDNTSIHEINLPWGVTFLEEGITENPATGGQATTDNRKDYNGAGDLPWHASAFGYDDYGGVIDTVLVNSLGNWFSWDVTVSLTNFLFNNIPNYGWALIADSTDSNRFASQNHADTLIRPYLYIDYTTTVPPNSDLINNGIKLRDEDSADKDHAEGYRLVHETHPINDHVDGEKFLPTDFLNPRGRWDIGAITND